MDYVLANLEGPNFKKFLGPFIHHGGGHLSHYIEVKLLVVGIYLILFMCVLHLITGNYYIIGL